MSLREQLLKAGLVSAEKAKQSETEVRKQAYKIKKDKVVAVTEATRQAEEQRRQEAEAQRKRRQDQQLNREREAQKQRKEVEARARQLIESHRLNEADADIRYNFLVDGCYIRDVRVTRQQQRLLALGRIGIARRAENEYAVSLVPRETALKLAELCPDKLLLLYPESERLEED